MFVDVCFQLKPLCLFRNNFSPPQLQKQALLGNSWGHEGKRRSDFAFDSETIWDFSRASEDIQLSIF